MNVNNLWYIKRRSLTTTADIQRMNSPLNVSQKLWVKLSSQFVLLFFALQSHLCLPPSIPLISQDRPGLLGEQKAKAFLQHHPVPRELVVGGEAGRVGRAGGRPIGTSLLLVTKKEEKAKQLSWVQCRETLIK